MYAHTRRGVIQPPEIRKFPGRKKKKKRLEEHERARGSSQRKGKKNKPEMKTKEKAARQMSCGWCKGLHHNKRGCPDRAYYLALEARLKEELARANPNANVDAEVAPVGGGAANVAPDNVADDGPQVDANLNQTEQDVEDCLDDMPVSQAPTQDMPPSQQPSVEPAVTNAQPAAKKKLTPVRGQRPFTLSRTIGMRLYQNASTSLIVLNVCFIVIMFNCNHHFSYVNVLTVAYVSLNTTRIVISKSVIITNMEYQRIEEHCKKGEGEGQANSRRLLILPLIFELFMRMKLFILWE